MSKQSGLGNQLFIGGYDIGADVSDIGTISTPRATLPATGITQSAMARMFGQRDASAEFSNFFNPAADGAHPILSTLPTVDTQVMYLVGTSLGGAAFSMVGKQINYDPQRGNDGSLKFGVSVQGLGFFPDRRQARVFWAGIEAPPDLARLAGETDRATAELGVESEKRIYSPHLTLARNRHAAPVTHLLDAVDRMGAADFGAFTADRFFLYRSERGSGGSVYTKLSEHPFSR